MQGTISDSFEFRGVNFRDRFNIKVVKTDFILPPKRERKIAIPGRHGQYDYGAECWEERTIRLECDVVEKLSRADLREISYILGKKGKLYLWDEPDKYYIGEIYHGGEIMDFPKQNMRTFTLEFICEPFAYRESKVIEFEGELQIDYRGTMDTPCILELENPSKGSSGFLITHLKRR